MIKGRVTRARGVIARRTRGVPMAGEYGGRFGAG
jgi:hypothetical protein